MTQEYLWNVFQALTEEVGNLPVCANEHNPFSLWKGDFSVSSSPPY